MSTPVARASSTLGWVGILLAAAAFLVERAVSDIDHTRDQLRDERNRRVEAEDRAEQLHADLDGALEALHQAKGGEEPPAEA